MNASLPASINKQIALWFGAFGVVPLLLGGGIIVLLGFKVLGDMSVNESAHWMLDHFGTGFLVPFVLVLALVIAASHRMVVLLQSNKRETALIWRTIAMQGASGLSTLALTFTLLGIALGIGTLSEQVLTPETVQGIVQSLTGHFSMAFMTTVVGLPVSVICQTIVQVIWQKGLVQEHLS